MQAPVITLDFLQDDSEDTMNDFHQWNRTYMFFSSLSDRHPSSSWLEIALKVAQLDINVLRMEGKLINGKFRTTMEADVIRDHLTSKLSVFQVRVGDEQRIFWTSKGLPSIYTNQFFSDTDLLSEASMEDFWETTLQISRVAYIPNGSYDVSHESGKPCYDASCIFNNIVFFVVLRDWDKLVQAGRINSTGVKEDPIRIKIKTVGRKIRGTPIGHPWRLFSRYRPADFLRFANVFAKKFSIEYAKSL